jgi:hypothetical protein
MPAAQPKSVQEVQARMDFAEEPSLVLSEDEDSEDTLAPLPSSSLPTSSTSLTVAQALALRQTPRQQSEVSPATASSSLWAIEPTLAPKHKPDPNRQVGDGKPKLTVAEALAKRAMARQ